MYKHFLIQANNFYIITIVKFSKYKSIRLIIFYN